MTSATGRRRLVQRLGEWGRRYAPLEIFSTLTAVAGAAIASQVTTSAVAIAVAGAWSENIGYYGYALSRELRQRKRIDASADGGEPVERFTRIIGAVKALVWEFGVAEVLDSIVVRPLCMYVALGLIDSVASGIVAGKLMADSVFYAFAIFFYELGKKRSGRA